MQGRDSHIHDYDEHTPMHVSTCLYADVAARVPSNPLMPHSGPPTATAVAASPPRRASTSTAQKRAPGDRTARTPSHAHTRAPRRAPQCGSGTWPST